ncbi:hypothetical protein K439DRAFT_42583 [Ramaria rubella]|nr:hypothetical protein K439DRAFT_42583 [Ramaria rubella]
MEQDRHAKRRRVDNNSNIISLLETLGIPVHDTSMQKTPNSEVKTRLSASNVEQQHLREYYGWEFYPRMGGLNPAACRTLRDVENYVDDVRYAQIDKMLKLPSDWQSSSGGDMVSLTRGPLALELGVLDVEFCSRELIKNLPYSEPNVIPYEIKPDFEDPALCIEWTMLKMLRYRGLSACRSELGMDRHKGACLAGFFKVQGCLTFLFT